MFIAVSRHVAPTEREFLLDASYKHLAALRPDQDGLNLLCIKPMYQAKKAQTHNQCLLCIFVHLCGACEFTYFIFAKLNSSIPGPNTSLKHSWATSLYSTISFLSFVFTPSR
jgi:hypothetical protein